jgi:2,3-bisphosphoglycerate-independent phosphoglycerate mutase
MKYAIVIPDGCADEPQESLDGRTPLEAAHTPNMDRVATAGVVGRAGTVPAHLPPGSDVANLSLLGYDPNVYFTGRAPLEAAAQGIELGAEDWAIRCNLVTIEDQTMKSFTADQITSEEARELLAAAQEALDDEHLEYMPGVSYRNLLIYRPGDTDAPFTRDTTTTPPHDLTDKTILNDFPRGPGSDVLNRLMAETVEVFRDHPVNQKRIAQGKLPATNVWLWGIGKRPALMPFAERFGKQGAMITAVDLLRGLAALVGWQRIEVPGATGYTDTDYAAKGQYAIETLAGTDVVCVHVEAPDEASHEGDVAAKIKALEEIDAKIVGPLLDHFEAGGEEFRLLVMPDHPTPVRTKTHSHGDVPFTICGTGIAADPATTYGENTATASELAFPEGWKLMNYFLGE